MANEDFFEANRRILNNSVNRSSQDFFDANRKILNNNSNSGTRYMNNVSTLNNSQNAGVRRKRIVKVYQQPKAYDRIRSARKRKSLIRKIIIGATIFTVVVSGAVVIYNLVSSSKNEDSKGVAGPTTSSFYTEASVDGQFKENSSEDTETYGFTEESEKYDSSDEESATYEDSTEENETYNSSDENNEDKSFTEESFYESYFTNDGEYDDVINYFNSFIDGQVYQIGTTPKVNEDIKNFLYNTEAGQYIQYYSKEFGVDPKMSVAIAAGESSLLHDMNDGAATGLFGLEKGIKDQFWVYDYYENKYVLIVNNPDDNYDIRTNIRNGIAILAYKYSDDGNIYDALCKYNFGTYGFNSMLDENYYECSSINDRGWRIYTDNYCSKYKMGTAAYIDNIGECLYEDNITMKCRDVEITMEYSTGKIISITKIPDYNYEEADTFDDIIKEYKKGKTL